MGYRWVEKPRIHWVFCLSVRPGFPHFVPRFVPRTYVRLIAGDASVLDCHCRQCAGQRLDASGVTGVG